MVENLQSHGVITSDEVAKAMEAVDRGLFVPDRSCAYVDSPLSIGYNVTISAPHMHAMCLQLLEKNLCSLCVAPPLGKPDHLEHPDATIQPDGDHIPCLHTMPRRLLANAVDADMTAFNQCGRTGAGLHHPRVPQPFIEPLALQMSGPG